MRNRVIAFAAVVLGCNAGAMCETVVVSNRGDGTVVAYDTGTREVVGEFAVGLGAHEFAVSPDGKRVVGSCYGSGQGHAVADNRLFVLDLTDGSHETIGLGGHARPNDMRFVDADRVVVTSEVKGCVLEVDLGKGEVAREIDYRAQAGHMLAASADGARVYVACVVPGSVVVIDRESGELLRTIMTGLGAEGIDVSPDGGRLWVANNRAGTVSVIDCGTMEVVKTITADGFPFRVRFTPDGERVVIAHPGSDEVRVYDAEKMEEVGRVRTGGQPTCIAVNGDGTRVFAVCGMTREIAEVDLEKMEVVHRYPTGDTPDAIAVSPVELGC